MSVERGREDSCTAGSGRGHHFDRNAAVLGRQFEVPCQRGRPRQLTPKEADDVKQGSGRDGGRGGRPAGVAEGRHRATPPDALANILPKGGGRRTTGDPGGRRASPSHAGLSVGLRPWFPPRLRVANGLAAGMRPRVIPARPSCCLLVLLRRRGLRWFRGHPSTAPGPSRQQGNLPQQSRRGVGGDSRGGARRRAVQALRSFAARRRPSASSTSGCCDRLQS
jgi:hypothetical protein